MSMSNEAWVRLLIRIGFDMFSTPSGEIVPTKMVMSTQGIWSDLQDGYDKSDGNGEDITALQDDIASELERKGYFSYPDGTEEAILQYAIAGTVFS